MKAGISLGNFHLITFHYSGNDWPEKSGVMSISESEQVVPMTMKYVNFSKSAISMKWKIIFPHIALLVFD